MSSSVVSLSGAATGASLLPVIGQRQRRGRGVAVAIGDLVGEDIGQRLARLQALHRRIGGIEHVAVAAIGVSIVSVP